MWYKNKDGVPSLTNPRKKRAFDHKSVRVILKLGQAPHELVIMSPTNLLNFKLSEAETEKCYKKVRDDIAGGPWKLSTRKAAANETEICKNSKKMLLSFWIWRKPTLCVL